MSIHDSYSDEFLNAYVDGELDQEETGGLLRELRHNQELGARIADLEKIRGMVRFAYNNIPVYNHEQGRNKPVSWTWMTIAAGILLSIGVVLGWSMQYYNPAPNGLIEIAEAMQINPVAKDDSRIRMVLNVTTNNKNKLETVLDETEKFLKRYRNSAQKVSLDILTNGKGLKLLMANHSPYADRIKRLQEEYENLTFKACKRAIMRVQHKTGKDIIMLPGTVVVPSALGEIMEKKKEGWSYIKI
ncbi:MAG TPA: hypothetical protein ENI65_10505 [Gammaproteobacteria bacterium]|nr:hypothetical protein [Gammaproteobacteria bacterium]